MYFAAIFLYKGRISRLSVQPRWQPRTYFFNHFLLWPPCVADADIIFCSCGFYLLSFFFPRLFSVVRDWMSTILPHMMCLVRI